MSEAVFPSRTPTPAAPHAPSRTLPFYSMASVVKRPDTVLFDNMPISVWPAPGRVTPQGIEYDHSGEAPLAYADTLGASNIALRVDGYEYMVVGCQPQTFVPHVVLLLRRTKSAGA